MERVLVHQDDEIVVWEIRNADGVVVGTDVASVKPQPLQGHQVVCCLNAVLGLWSVQDAANAAGVEPAALVAEAQAWAAAQALSA